tara:strand:- start:251 stop:487 length:237 start_codon:yes stop_codon:yes gene_type:complete
MPQYRCNVQVHEDFVLMVEARDDEHAVVMAELAAEDFGVRSRPHAEVHVEVLGAWDGPDPDADMVKEAGVVRSAYKVL